MGISVKKRVRGIIATGMMVAGVALTHDVEASQNVDNASSNPKLKDAIELFASGQEEVSQAEQGQTHEFLEKIKKGEKIEYNGMTFDVSKIKSSKNKDLKNFNFVFEDGKVGVSIFNDGKKLFGKDDPAKTYKILMSADDFEGIMNMLMAKDQKQTSDGLDFQLDRDPYPHVYVNDVEGMTKEDAAKLFDGLRKAILAANGVAFDGGKAIKNYKELIEKADYGWMLVKAADAPASIQNILLSEGLENYKESFVNMVSNVDTLRENYHKEMEIRQQVAQMREEKAAERASAPVITEDDRLDQILIVDRIGKPVIDTKDGVHLSFTCDGGHFDIHTDNQKITDSSVSFAGHRRVLPIQPEEWRMIAKSLDRLPEKTKKELGPQFFKLVREQGTQQTISPALLASVSTSR